MMIKRSLSWKKRLTEGIPESPIPLAGGICVDDMFGEFPDLIVGPSPMSGTISDVLCDDDVVVLMAILPQQGSIDELRAQYAKASSEVGKPGKKSTNINTAAMNLASTYPIV
eukprot:jgi/Hompol1/4235/HPOL_001183-RA